LIQKYSTHKQVIEESSFFFRFFITEKQIATWLSCLSCYCLIQ